MVIEPPHKEGNQLDRSRSRKNNSDEQENWRESWSTQKYVSNNPGGKDVDMQQSSGDGPTNKDGSQVERSKSKRDTRDSNDNRRGGWGTQKDNLNNRDGIYEYMKLSLVNGQLKESQLDRSKLTNYNSDDREVGCWFSQYRSTAESMTY